jgi:hypothetical protein
VRTYGTHFLFAYDPGFQQARCLVELGRFAEARVKLAAAELAGVTPRGEVARLAERLEVLAQPVREPAAEGVPPVVEAPTPSVRPPAPTPRSEASGAPPEPAPVERAPPVLTRPEPGLEEAARLPAARPPEPERSPTVTPASPAAETPSGEPVPTTEAPATASPLEEPGTPLAWTVVGGVVLATVGASAALLWRQRRRRRRSADVIGSHWHLKLLAAKLGGYELLAELGRGGMAATFRARRLRDGRVVALKVPHPSGDATYLERFVREGKLGEALHHPAIVRIFEAGEEQGVPYLAMELLEGRTLKQEIEAHPEGLGVRRALVVARSIAEALDYAHGKGVVHRDLKPENVMLLPDSAVKVMDFGVARVEGQPGLTTSQFFLGSPLYAAPEAIEPHRLDARSDLYSLGVLLYEMLEGCPPFVHESIFKVLELHQRQPLPAREALARPVPAAVWSLVLRLCAKAPEDRFPSAQALLVALAQVLEGLAEPG